MAGGLTFVPLDEEEKAKLAAGKPLLVEDATEKTEEMSEEVKEVVVVSKVVEAPKGKGKSGRERVPRREGLRSRTVAGAAGVEKD